MYEVDEAAKRITREVMQDSNIITGTSIDPNLEGTVRVSVVATGIDEEAAAKANANGSAFARSEPQSNTPAQSIKPIAPKPAAAPAPIQAKTIAPIATPTSVQHYRRGWRDSHHPGHARHDGICTLSGEPTKAQPSSTAERRRKHRRYSRRASSGAEPRNPIAPLPESLLTPPARNEMMDMRDLPASQTAATASGMRHEPAAPLQVPTFRQAQPITAEVRENKLLRAQHEVAQRPAPVFEEPTVEAQPEAYAAPAPQAFAPPVEPISARGPEPRTMFEPLVAPSPGPAYEEAEADHEPLYDDEPQRAGNPLGRLLDLARGGFSTRSSADDVHEAELRQSAHESGFDRLDGGQPARRENVSMGRGLNTGAQRPALTSISATPMDSPEMDLDESEMNIPAFLRRQIN